MGGEAADSSDPLGDLVFELVEDFLFLIILLLLILIAIAFLALVLSLHAYPTSTNIFALHLELCQCVLCCLAFVQKAAEFLCRRLKMPEDCVLGVAKTL